AELEMPALGITDHGVMYGAIHFYKACKDAGIKPIIGCEVYVAPRSRLLREGRVDRDPNHLTLLAANHEGYVNLMRLCTIGQMEGMYYKPRVDKEVLAQYSKGLIALSGCLQGEAASRIVDGDVAGAREAVAGYRDIFGKERFLLEVQRHGIDRQVEVNGVLTGFGKEFGLRLCATLLPPFDVPDGLKPDEYLRRLVMKGLEWRYGQPSQEAKERADQELSVILATGYASYFLIVWDFYNYARQIGIVVGPGRGSAAGSLVSYCLGI